MVSKKTFKIDLKSGIVAVIEIQTKPSGGKINVKITIGPARRTANHNTGKVGIKNGTKGSKTRKPKTELNGFALCIQHILKHLKTHSLNIKID